LPDRAPIRASGNGPIRSRQAAWLLAGAAALWSIVGAGEGRAAGPVAQLSLTTRTVCASAIQVAELRHGLPEGLLQAIAIVESGRHPFAINLGPEDGARYPARRAEAHALILDALGRGERPMVGCLQVNVAVHAPQDPSWALDPSRAADWAAIYLASHARVAGSQDTRWHAAVVRYQGGRGASADRYVCRVAGALNRLGHTETEWLLLGAVALDDERVRRRCETAWHHGATTAEALRTPFDQPATDVVTLPFMRAFSDQD
jgi:hypothetical protein